MQRGHYPHRGAHNTRRIGNPRTLGTPAGGRTTRWALLALASVVAALGLGQMAEALTTNPAEASQPTADMNGLAAVADSVTWIEHEHENPAGKGGYQMPLSMMPGMPAEGTVRLAVSLTLSNTANAFRQIDPVGEFRLRDTDGGTWTAGVDTFGELSRLPAGSQVDGTLFFDVTEEHAHLAQQDDADHHGAGHFYLEWLHDGMAMRLTLPLNGPAPDHSHGT